MMKLYVSSSTDLCTQLCIATASLAGVPLQTIIVDDALKSSKEFGKKNITG